MAKEMKIAKIYATDDRFEKWMQSFDRAIEKLDALEESGDLVVRDLTIEEAIAVFLRTGLEEAGMPKSLTKKPIKSMTLEELEMLKDWFDETLADGAIRTFVPEETDEEDEDE